MQIKEIKGPINIINEFTTRVRLMISSESKTLEFVSDLLMLGNVPFFFFLSRENSKVHDCFQNIFYFFIQKYRRLCL